MGCVGGSKFSYEFSSILVIEFKANDIWFRFIDGYKFGIIFGIEE